MLARIMPFIGLGLFVVLLVVGIIFLSYLFILGAAVGLILFAIAWIKAKFSHKSSIASPSPHGHVYDHDEIK